MELLPSAVVSQNYQPGAWRFIIRFGDATGSDANAFVLNRAAVLDTPNLLARAQEHWRASSVRFRTDGQSLSFYKRYRVQVFDLTPIYMQKAEIGKRRPYAVRPNSTQEARRVGDLAVKALYLSGLDAGSVDIGLSSGGRLYVFDINTKPRMSKRIGAAYAKHIQIWMQRVEKFYPNELLPSLWSMQETKCDNYLLGADPEFALRDARTGRMVFASDFFPMQGVIGCDARRVRMGRSGYPLAEVRPAPSSCPLELHARIQQALRRASRQVPHRYIQWRAGTLPFSKLPVGGHIHFSMLPTSQLLRALDNYLAIFFLMLENPAAARNRRRRYGWLGDYRLKAHGGFEYRVIPSWLVNPVFARGALCLAKVIGCDWRLLRQDLLQDPKAKVAFRQADREFFRAHMPALLHTFRSLPTYKNYKDEIEAVFTYLEEDKCWKTAGDIRRLWRLPRGRRRR